MSKSTEFPNEMPETVAEIVRVTHKKGFETFKPWFVPEVDIKEEKTQHNRNVKKTSATSSHDWDVIVEDLLYRALVIEKKSGKLPPDVLTTKGQWLLIDTGFRPGYQQGKQIWDNDPIAQMLEKGRSEGLISVPQELAHIPQTSRFGVLPQDQDTYVFPSLAKAIGLENELEQGLIEVRRMTILEFMLAGHTVLPELFKTHTDEWLHERYDDDHTWMSTRHNPENRIIPIRFRSIRDNISALDQVAFRPVIVISEKYVKDRRSMLYHRYDSLFGERGEAYEAIFKVLQNHEQTIDAVSEVMIRAIERINSSTNPNIEAWIRTVARNYAIGLTRRSERKNVPYDQNLHDQPVDLSVDGHSAERLEIIRKVRLALDKLPPDYKKILLLVQEGKSSAEIGTEMGRTPGAINTAAFNARKRLVVECQKLGISSDDLYE